MPKLRMIGSWDLEPGPDVSITTYLIVDGGSERSVLYQVPVTFRRAPLESATSAPIAQLTDTDGTPVWLYDGPHDPAYAERLLQLVCGGRHAQGDGAVADGVPITPFECHNVRSRVLSGEQSNTSIVYEYDVAGGPAGCRAICKVFRTLAHGENPDVVLQSALSAAGSRSVPATLGSVVGQWPDPREPGGRAPGHLAFAQEFFSGVEDGWRHATAAAAGAVSFASSARAMGAATADVHATLAEVLPTTVAEDADIAAMVAQWRARLDAAIAAVPELAALRKPIEALQTRAAAGPWPRLQRIHGDLHLGQVLSMPGGGWAIIDFEGEPMRPLAERSEPDVALRDVAGMLRSFDYVRGAEPDAQGVAAWAEDCRAAFIDGYARRSGQDVQAQGVLVDAFELDKALYETVYEARNRPAWLPIPMAAVRRLAQRAR
ncbi:hypothetical protein GCM10022240_01280 [Microbacterium kribbense]|uniref:Maltokinase n=1 Tax=Microbacterium kribbense TaxID=433645 RepID=A0ABP7G002_9MICO